MAIVVVAVDLAVAVAVNAVVAVLLAGRGSFAFNVTCVLYAVRAEGVCAVVNPGAEDARPGFFATDRARAIAVRRFGPFAVEWWRLAVSPGSARVGLPFDASGAGERAIKRRLVISLVVAVVGHAVLDHVAFAMVRPFTATLWQVQVLVRYVVGYAKYLASPDLLAIVGCKVAIDDALL